VAVINAAIENAASPVLGKESHQGTENFWHGGGDYRSG